MSTFTTSIDTPIRRPRLRIILAFALVGLLAIGATLAQAGITQNGNLRVTVSGKISPHSLPRIGTAPIAVSVGGQISTTDGSPTPHLNLLKIEINRSGRLDYSGLPVCSLPQIQPASSGRALAGCRSALVGQGSFSATVSLAGQAPYPTQGRLLVFNGREHGRQVLFGHIYSLKPFSSSFVITFQISNHHHGPYGTTLTANLSKSLGAKRNLTGIEMTLSRLYSYRGARQSFLSSGCPAPKGFHAALFSLARTSFLFPGKTLTSTLTSTCGVR